eukprot:2129554-Rhodomonas_salina.6
MSARARAPRCGSQPAALHPSALRRAQQQELFGVGRRDGCGGGGRAADRGRADVRMAKRHHQDCIQCCNARHGRWWSNGIESHELARHAGWDFQEPRMADRRRRRDDGGGCWAQDREHRSVACVPGNSLRILTPPDKSA